MQHREALAAVLRGLRTARGLTQIELPDITERYLSNLEKGQGNPTIDVLVKIATVLEVSPATLMLLFSAAADGAPVEDHVEQTLSQLVELHSSGAFEEIAKSAALDAPTMGRPVAPSSQRLQRMQQLRAEGLNNAEIAARLGVSKSTVQRHLSGK